MLACQTRNSLQWRSSLRHPRSLLYRRTFRQPRSSPSRVCQRQVQSRRGVFYKWHAELEASMKSQTEEKYRQYMSDLTSHVRTCDHILEQIESTLSLFSQLQQQHSTVAARTQTLHDAAQRLVGDKERLLEFADALRSKLNYFEELDKIAAKFHSASVGVTSAHFLPLLKRLDECITYVASNPQYADSNVYLLKFRQMQSRALGMVRSHTLAVLRAAATQVLAAVKESASSAVSSSHSSPASHANSLASLSEGAETSLLYVRFKAAAGELKALMAEMESRSARREYAQLLTDCHAVYCEQRLSLVQAVVQQRIIEYSRRESLPSLTRSGCAYLMQVCQSEHQLFDHFFPAASADASNLAPLIDPLCTILYDVLRPRFIHAADVEALCELVDIVRAEVLEEQLGRRGEAVAGLRPTVQRLLADIQERLIFRAHAFMRDEISNYVPSAADLDYPAKLQRAAAAKADATSEESEEDAFAGWYPPVESTLACLSKLYRCVSANIFTGLAQEAVAVCADSIQRASKVISRKSSPTDGQLFLTKHLLILREQISPFNVEFAVTVKELDFGHTLDHLRRVLRGQASFLSLTSGSSLMRVAPRVTENQVDAKKELERLLKATCEQFIMSVTKVAVEPILSFITKVTAVRVAGSSHRKPSDPSAANGALLPAGHRALREQAFATPEKVAHVMAQVNEALQGPLTQVVVLMRLYLPNDATRAILFRPIKSNIIEAHSQLHSLIDSEYTASDCQVMSLQPMQQLQAFLDGLQAS